MRYAHGSLFLKPCLFYVDLTQKVWVKSNLLE